MLVRLRSSKSHLEKTRSVVLPDVAACVRADASAAQQDIATRTSAGTEPIELLGVGSKLHRMPSILSTQTILASAPRTPPRESSAEIPMDNTFDALRGFFDVDACTWRSFLYY